MNNQLPISIVTVIADYAMIYTLVSWMREIDNNPDMHYVSDYKSDFLWANPMAEDELRPLMDSGEICGSYLSRNNADWALDILEANPEYLDRFYIIKNTNPRAIEMIKDNIPDWFRSGQWASDYILANPSALGVVKKYELYKPDDCPLSAILSNPSDQIPEFLGDALFNLNDFNIFGLMSNPAPWAIELIKKYGIRFNHSTTYKNPHPFVCSQILENIDDIWDRYPFWHELINKNPGMIDYLRDHPDKINKWIWRNPAIFEPTPRPGVFNILTELSW